MSPPNTRPGTRTYKSCERCTERYFTSGPSPRALTRRLISTEPIEVPYDWASPTCCDYCNRQTTSYYESTECPL